MSKRKGIFEEGDVLISPSKISELENKYKEEYDSMPISEEAKKLPPIIGEDGREIIIKEAYKNFAKETEMYGDIDSETGMKMSESKEFSGGAETFAWGDITATGTYVRCGVRGPQIIENRRLRYWVKFWCSSDSVYNNDGNGIEISFSYEGGSSGWIRLTTRYGTLGSWEGYYDWSLPSGKTWVNVRARTLDLNPGDSRFYAETGNITCYKGTYSVTSISRDASSNTAYIAYRATEDEDFSFHAPDGSYKILAVPKTDSSGSTTSYTMSMPVNSAYTREYGLIPSGTGGPWCWDSSSIEWRTTYSPMPMPTVSARRDSSDPSRVIVSWTAGGTANKPQGDARRTPFAILRRPDSSNVTHTSDINLEVANSYTFTGCPLNEEFDAFVEYSITGLEGGTHYTLSNKVRIKPAFTTRVKVGGTYRDSHEGYVKVGGSYKRIVEGFVKVGGVYKRIV